jgi:hypothetical protein
MSWDKWKQTLEELSEPMRELPGYENNDMPDTGCSIRQIQLGLFGDLRDVGRGGEDMAARKKSRGE